MDRHFYFVIFNRLRDIPKLGYSAIVSVLGLWTALGCQAEDCPASASTCPDHCGEVQGMEWNEDQVCWDVSASVTVGCEEKDDLVEAVESCIVRKSDGKAFRIGGFPPETSEFTQCFPESGDECGPCTGEARDTYCDVED